MNLMTSRRDLRCITAQSSNLYFGALYLMLLHKQKHVKIVQLHRFNYAACSHIRKIMPIMLGLCLMLLYTYHAKNYAGIINSGLAPFVKVLDLSLSESVSIDIPAPILLLIYVSCMSTIKKNF